jgi:AcrR family transcriptional regulator
LSKAIPAASTSRTEQKGRTRDALRRAALELFASRGFDTTTAEDIALQAGVSGRTFFRYFPTKESVLWAGERHWVESFTQRYPVQPAELSDVDAMCATIIELAPSLGSARRSLLQYRQAVASSVTLRGREQDHTREDTEKLAEAIAARRGSDRVDESCVLLAAVGMLTYLRALEAWLAGPDDADIARVIADEFKILNENFAS